MGICIFVFVFDHDCGLSQAEYVLFFNRQLETLGKGEEGKLRVENQRLTAR